MDDDAAGFGASNANYETTVVAGNTFDYPAMHGRSIAAAGYSFVSVSRDAVLDGTMDMNSYKLVDLILGKQRQTKIGRGVSSVEFKTFTKELQSKITDYCKQGGNIFISGAYVASDLWDTEKPLVEDQKFAADVLKYFSSYKKFFCNIPIEGYKELKANKYDFGVTSPYTNTYKQDIDCGRIQINETFYLVSFGICNKKVKNKAD